MEYIFPSLYFQSVCFLKAEVSLLQATYSESCVFIHSATLHVFIAEYSPFPYKVIIDRYRLPIAILLLSGCFVFQLFPSSLILFLSLRFDDFSINLLYI